LYRKNSNSALPQRIALSFTFWGFLICLSGCGQSFSNNPNGGNAQTHQFGVVSFEVSEGEQPGVYQVLITPLTQESFSVFRNDLITSENHLVSEDLNEPMIDFDVISGRIYRYEIRKRDGDPNDLIQVEEIHIPLDIRLDSGETFEIKRDHYQETSLGVIPIEINRVFLAPDSELITGAGHLRVNIQEIHSDKGIISNSTVGRKAEDGKPGLSGGELHFAIEKLSGEVTFILRGEAGGNGIRPEPLGEAGRGQEGTIGEQGRARIMQSSLTGYVEQIICTRRPGQGSRGGKGKTGRPANDGLPGGDSGKAFIKIKDSHLAHISYRLEVGVGGEPSLGGEGGPGGHGGPPGGVMVEVYDIDDEFDYTYFEPDLRECRGSTGPVGPTGDMGPAGKPGEDGKIERICIQRNQGEATQCFS
jgi:hypothetical protein